MDVDDLLSRLEMVKPRGSGRWSARCPGPLHQHGDRHPSLQITEGEKAILLKCWPGCSLEEICQALGIEPKDLFYDTHQDPQRWQEQKRQRARERAIREQERRAEGKLIDCRREADNVLRAAKGINISQWSDAQLDAAMDRVADAYGVLEREQCDGPAGI